MAKKIADALAQPVAIGSPEKRIDEFFSRFNPKEEATIRQRNGDAELLSTFTSKYPAGNLNNLSLESFRVFRHNG